MSDQPDAPYMGDDDDILDVIMGKNRDPGLDDPKGHDRDQSGYDHDAYMERWGVLQATFAHVMSENVMHALEPLIDEIVLLDELCDPGSPKDGLYWAQFNLVMIRLLTNEINNYTRIE